MPRVSEWFDDWAATHRARSGRTDWPKLATEDGRVFWANVESALVRHGASQEVADEASAVVSEIPDVFPNRFLPLLTEAVKSIHARKRAEGGGDSAPNSIDQAKAASHECPECRGQSGLALRFVHPEHAGRFVSPRGVAFPVGAHVTLFCGCPLGYQLRKMNLDAPRDQRSRMAGIYDFPEFAIGPVLWSESYDNQYRYHPDDWNAVDGRPMPIAPVTDPRLMARTLAVSGKAPGVLYERRPGSGTTTESPRRPDRLSEAVALREAMASQPPEYPRIPDSSERPSSPVEEAEATGWF